MSNVLRKAINDYKPVQRRILSPSQVQGGSRGVAGNGPGRPVKRVKYGGVKTKRLPRPAQGQN